MADFMICNTLDFQINVPVCLLISGKFSRGYNLIWEGTFIKFWVFSWSLISIFILTFTLVELWEIFAFFWIHSPGGTFIEGGTFIFFHQIVQGVCLLGGVRLFGTLEYLKYRNIFKIDLRNLYLLWELYQGVNYRQHLLVQISHYESDFCHQNLKNGINMFHSNANSIKSLICIA